VARGIISSGLIAPPRRGDAEILKNKRMFEETPENKITEKIIGCAIEVHRGLGPGLLESAYEECLYFELTQAGLQFERQVPLPVIYKGVKLDCGYRIDIVVENLVIVEIKAIEKILPVHEAQLLSYLKLYNKKVGLLINFHVPILKSGLKRLVNNL
jgi:GxxExxY protein